MKYGCGKIRLIEVSGTNFLGWMVAMIGPLIVFIPILMVAFVLRWVSFIQINSEVQIEQNKEMISILREITEKSNT